MVLSMDRWIGKVAVVTGASSGIGASIAEKLVEAGLQVPMDPNNILQVLNVLRPKKIVVTKLPGFLRIEEVHLRACVSKGEPKSTNQVAGLARRKDRLEEIAKKLSGKSGKFHPIQTDLSSESDLLKAFKWIKDNIGPVHILINNAGLLGFELLSEGKTELWTKVLQVNVIGLSIATREAIKDMKENKVDGHIINMNSIWGHYVLNTPLNMYFASKHGVTALTECLRQELATLGSKIKVTSISPGVVDTEIIPDTMKEMEDYKKKKETKGVLESEDITDGVMYVLSTPPHVQVHELMIRPVGEMF